MKQDTPIKPRVGIGPLAKLWPWLKSERHLIALAALLIPAVAVVTMLQPLFVKNAIDDGILKGDTTTTLSWAAGCLGLSIAAYFLNGAQSISASIAVHRMIHKLRSKLMRHVMELPASWHDSQVSGALATRATSDFDTLSESLNQGVLSSIVDVIVLIGCIVGMFILSVKLALIAIVILPIMTWLVIWFSRKLNSSMLTSRRNLANLNGFTQEAITSLTAVKLLNAESSASGRYDKLNKSYKDAQLENVFFDALMFASIDGISSITLGVSLFLIIRLTTNSEIFSAGIMVAFVQYIQQLFEPLKQLGTKMAMLQGALTSIERIFGLIDLDQSITGNKFFNWPSQVAIHFKNVTFCYKKNSQPALSNLTFEVNAGQSLAIIGRTGSGKSTIIKLLTKLYDSYEGSIEITGQPIKDIDPVLLRQKIGIVPQDLVLFEGSISFNIGLNREGVTNQKIMSAAKTVGADDFIKNLPGGFDHIVRENGSNLSQGQRQLIVFARALVNDPSLVILDEATSSIDPQSEALVQSATAKLFENRTVIVIAHRLETVKKCDLILVLENGKVQEIGDRRHLESTKSRYQELLDLGAMTPGNKN